MCVPLKMGVRFHAPIPPSFIHWPNETSKTTYGMPTTIDDIKNGMRKAPFCWK